MPFRHRNIAEFLLMNGADPMAVSPGDSTALDMATQNHHDDIVRWLKSLPPNPGETD